MFTITTRLDIQRPVEDVFTYVTDPRNSPQWQAAVQAVKVTPHGPPRVGTKATHMVPLLGMKLKPTYEITSLKPNRCVSCRGSAGPAALETTLLFEAVGTATRLSATLQVALGGLFTVAWPLFAVRFQKLVESDLQRLKALLEAQLTKDLEGQTQWAWAPRSYGVQADLSALTGAQASIYARARVTLRRVTPLLDGLTPLTVTVPPEEQESMRTMVRSAFSELVDDLAVEGGTRIPRVDSLFTQLLGVSPTTPKPPLDAATVGAQLGDLRDRLGLTRTNVNTHEDEQNLTNYIMLVDYIACLYQSWQSLKQMAPHCAIPW